MEETFTTHIEQKNGGVEIFSIHDQTGGCAPGWVHNENIRSLIHSLQNILAEMPCNHTYENVGGWNRCSKCGDVFY